MEVFKEVLNKIESRYIDELLSKSQEEIVDEWYFVWDDSKTKEYNSYNFFKILELHSSRWRRWEEHHNGPCCVVERVRDKYIMPRIKEFLEKASQ